MSSRLDDLPGGDLEQVYEEVMPQAPIQQQQVQQQPRYEEETVVQQQPVSNVSMQIKKKVHFEDEVPTDFFSFLRSQISEDNLLLLVLLVVASRNEFDNYIQLIPFVGSFVGDSGILVTTIKGVILLLTYILLKHFLLPKIKI
jgi:hypothetical protein